MSNHVKKVSLILVDEDGALAISSEIMKTYHNIYIIAQNTGVNAYSLSGKGEIPHNTLSNITRVLLLKLGHKKELW